MYDTRKILLTFQSPASYSGNYQDNTKGYYKRMKHDSYQHHDDCRGQYNRPDTWPRNNFLGVNQPSLFP